MNKLEWFAGDNDALDLYERLVFIAHAWDDLIDKDKEMDAMRVNALMANLLLYLPGNAFYKRFEGEMRALFLVGFNCYVAANLMEKSEDTHQLELAHYLRYAITNVVVFAISVLNGADAHKIIAEAMPVMIPERVSDYVKEHGHAI